MLHRLRRQVLVRIQVSVEVGSKVGLRLGELETFEDQAAVGAFCFVAFAKVVLQLVAAIEGSRAPTITIKCWTPKDRFAVLLHMALELIVASQGRGAITSSPGAGKSVARL